MRDQQHLVVAVLAGGLPRGLSQVSPGKLREHGSSLGMAAVLMGLDDCRSDEGCPRASHLTRNLLDSFFRRLTGTGRDRDLHEP